MIIGNGLLAKTFSSFENTSEVTIFASGVSNSKETSAVNFNRERDLLLTHLKSAHHFVYFSTTSIDDPLMRSSDYVKHKLEMERLIRESNKTFHIFRLSQVLGSGGNPNTLINFLTQKIENNEKIEIYANATRNIIQVKDVQKIIERFINQPDSFNKIINVATPWDVKIQEIVEVLEKFLKKSAVKELIPKGMPLKTDIQEIENSGYQFSPANPGDYLMNGFMNYIGDRL